MYIVVRIKNNYGREAIYPVCDHAILFAKLAGTTTLTRASLELIKSLGYEIRVEAQSL